MTVKISAFAGAGWQFSDANGVPLSGGKVYTYDAGTTTPRATYTTKAGNIAHSNPIILDSAGRVNEVWLDDGVNYKFVLQDANGVLIGSYDNIPSINETVTLNIAVSIVDYGADPTGQTNSTDAINAAIAASNCVFIPQGTYLLEPTVTSGDFMLYLGTAGGRPSKNGLIMFGTGNTSVLKLGNNVGRNPLIFGAGTGDTIANMIFRDFAINLNGANNLQTSFSDPLRYNSAFYFYCACYNVLFDHLYIYDGSGSQWIRCGGDSIQTTGANIQVLNCRFNNFGIGIPGNYQQDVSVLYIEADGIVIDSCWWQNSNFAFDLSRGQTAMELHATNSTVVTNNRFTYTQMPCLLVSAYTTLQNVVIDSNVMYECAYMVGFDPAQYDQKRVTISNNIYQSTKMSGSGIIGWGNSTEPAKSREDILIIGNTITCWGNTNKLVNVIYCESAYLRSVVIQDNIVGGMYGSLIYFAGNVKNDGYADIVIKNNRLDSLGNVGGSTYPTDPCFIFVDAGYGGTVNSLVIDGNVLFNSAGKNYSGLGAFHVGHNINYLYIDNTESMLNSAYPEVTESSLVTVKRRIDVDGWVVFPATRVPSSNKNTLDYYEEGTWTPTLITSGTDFTSVTYGAATKGNYTLVGNLCTVTGLLVTDAVTVGGATGSVRIGGLPFTANATAARGGISVSGSTTWAVNNPTGGDVADSWTYINLSTRTTASGGSTPLVVADVSINPSANIIAFTAMYYI